MTARRIIRDKPYYKGVTLELGSPTSRGRVRCTYEPGKTVVADSLDVDTAKECSHGIFFCGTIAEALHWGPKVVAVHPVGLIIDTGTKLRAAKVKVIEEVDLSGANLTGPTSPGPTSPGPTSPGPTSPGPTSPGPTSPGPTSPGPTSPGPTSPGPTSPGPTSPGPTSPGPTTSKEPMPTRPPRSPLATSSAKPG